MEDQLDPSAKAKAQPAVPQILVLRGENGHAIIVLVKKLPTQIEGGVALRVETATTKEEFVALRESWEALTAPDKGGARTPFQSWGVTYHAWAMESAATSPLVLVARSGDEKVEGILALGVRRGRRGSFRWRDLRTIGPTRLDFVDMIAAPGSAREVLQAWVDWLGRHWRRWDELQLNPIREDAVLLRHLDDIRLPRFMARQLDAVGVNQALSIPAGASGWEDACDGEHRRTTRRIVRKLEADGFRVRRASEDIALDDAIDALVDLHARRRDEFGQKSRLADVGRSELRAFVVSALASGGDLTVLQRGEDVVAAQLTLRHGDSMSHYRLAFDSEYKKWSPGIGLLVAAIDRAAKSGIREYDFGFGAEEYKRRWANKERTVYRLRLRNGHVGRVPRRLWLFASQRIERLRAKVTERRRSEAPGNCGRV